MGLRPTSNHGLQSFALLGLEPNRVLRYLSSHPSLSARVLPATNWIRAENGRIRLTISIFPNFTIVTSETPH